MTLTPRKTGSANRQSDRGNNRRRESDFQAFHEVLPHYSARKRVSRFHVEFIALRLRLRVRLAGSGRSPFIFRNPASKVSTWPSARVRAITAIAASAKLKDVFFCEPNKCTASTKTSEHGTARRLMLAVAFIMKSDQEARIKNDHPASVYNLVDLTAESFVAVREAFGT
jgi:hypothetical protein